MKQSQYPIMSEWIEQKVSHGDPTSARFSQRVKLLIPPGDEKKTKVLFVMGLEQDLSDKWLMEPYRAFGSRSDMVVLCAEHRGYGKSISGEDQSVPGYISVSEALADYHAVREQYAARFPGEWIVYGCSYGGGLAIHYAHAYSDDAKVVICSSGVTDWNAMLPEYDVAARENLGEALYERLCVHIDHLTPAEPFDGNWYARELIYAFVTGLCQYRENQSMRPLIAALAKLPTKAFIGLLRILDRNFAGGAASDYAKSNGMRTLSNAEAATCRYSWRVWRYQQAFMTGTFWAPSGARSIYRRSEADWQAECRLLFGQQGTVFSEGTGWNVRDMASSLKIPMLYIRGDRDPWRRVGLAEDDMLPNGKIITIPGGFHGPERYADTGIGVFAEALKYLKEDGVCNSDTMNG